MSQTCPGCDAPFTDHIHMFFAPEHAHREPLWPHPMLGRIRSGRAADGCL